MTTYESAAQLVQDAFRDEYPTTGPERHYVAPYGYVDELTQQAVVPHGAWGEFHDDPEDPWTGVTRDDVTVVDVPSGQVRLIPGVQDGRTAALLDGMTKVGPWPS